MCTPSPTPVFWFHLWPNPNPLAWIAAIGTILLAFAVSALVAHRFARRYRALAASTVYSRTRFALITGVAVGIVGTAASLIALPYQHLVTTWAKDNLARLASAHCSVVSVSLQQLQLSQTLDMWFEIVFVAGMVVIGLGFASGIGRNKLNALLRDTGVTR